MPFDLRSPAPADNVQPAGLPGAQPLGGAPRAVAFWLLGVAGLVWIMVAIGGATRLTGSGLSLTVHTAFIGLSAFVGAGLTFAGATGFCGMANLLAMAPWNRVAAR